LPLFSPKADHDITLLRHYIWAGVSIGILSPASMLAARALVSGSLSWHDAARLQALWRVSEWVAAIAAGIMSVHYLPRLSAAYGTPAFGRHLRRCALMTIAPSAAALVLLLLFHRPVFVTLYDASLAPDRLTTALFYAGSLARIASWVPLFALYAMRRTRALIVGELLSLPLFAVLLASFSEGLTLERAAAMWLVAYVVYGAFNLGAIRRTGTPRPLP
jgi:O-antigen/teichoic acid export membrane protein